MHWIVPSVFLFCSDICSFVIEAVDLYTRTHLHVLLLSLSSLSIVTYDILTSESLGVYLLARSGGNYDTDSK